MAKHLVVLENDVDLAAAMALAFTEQGYRVTSLHNFTNKEELAELNADLFIIHEKLPALYPAVAGLF